jgi:hypothetical protein
MNTRILTPFNNLHLPSFKLATLATNTISKRASKKFYDILEPWPPTMKRQRWLREEENSTAKQFLKSKMLLKHPIQTMQKPTSFTAWENICCLTNYLNNSGWSVVHFPWCGLF